MTVNLVKADDIAVATTAAADTTGGVGKMPKEVWDQMVVTNDALKKWATLQQEIIDCRKALDKKVAAAALAADTLKAAETNLIVVLSKCDLSEKTK